MFHESQLMLYISVEYGGTLEEFFKLLFGF